MATFDVARSEEVPKSETFRAAIPVVRRGILQEVKYPGNPNVARMRTPSPKALVYVVPRNYRETSLYGGTIPIIKKTAAIYA